MEKMKKIDSENSKHFLLCVLKYVLHTHLESSDCDEG